MTYSDSSATRYLAARSGGLLRAIAESVNALVSDMSASGSSRKRARAMILVKGQGAEVHDLRKNTVAGYDGESDVLVDFVFSNLPRSARKDVTLRFSGEHAIVKHLRLPSAAQDVLPAILRNKVESLAPWPLQESLWGYRVSDNAAPGEISVIVGIVSRKNAHHTVKQLHKGGVEIHRMEVAGPHSGNDIILDFGKETREKRLRSIVTSAMASLALCATALGGFGSYLAISNDKAIQDVRTDMDRTRLALQGVGAVSQDVRLAGANAIFEDKQKSPPFVVLLDELSKAVPDGIWLENINLENGKLLVTGRGVYPDKLVQSLEVSPFFAKVSFASAIQRDAENGTDVFTMAMEVEQHAAGQ